jgi:hypothetical protein
MEEVRSAYEILVAKPERKGPIGRHRLRCEDNIKTDRRELAFGVWIKFIRIMLETCGRLL